MEFPANALIASTAVGVPSGGLFRYDRNWCLKLPPGEGDPRGYIQYVNLNEERLGIVDWMSENNWCLTLAPRWHAEPRISEQHHIEVVSALPGTLCICPEGPAIYSIEHSSRLGRVFLLEDGSNVWDSARAHSGRVLGIQEWRMVLVRDGGTNEGPEIFRAKAA